MSELWFALGGLVTGIAGTGYLWYKHASSLEATITALQVEAAKVKGAATSVVSDIKKAV